MSNGRRACWQAADSGAQQVVAGGLPAGVVHEPQLVQVEQRDARGHSRSDAPA